MHLSRIAFIGVLTMVAACAATSKPKVFGTAPQMTPTVEIVGNDRLPMHLRITQPQSSYITALYVVPGEGTQMLYPTDSTGSKLLPAGTHDITTAFGIPTTVDTSRLLRRSPRPGAGRNPQGAQGGGGGAGAFQEAFVFVYASSDSLVFKALNDRVIGVSLPGYSDEAFNTVTKLIRAVATGNPPWSAVAVPFSH